MKQTTSFLNNHAHWLAQFDNHHFLSNLLDLFVFANFYIVDKNQKILYWSLGMESLTGLSHQTVIDNPCLPEYRITPNLPKAQSIQLPSINAVNKVIHILQDKDGVFAGGLGLLLPCPEQTPSEYLPKIAKPLSLGSQNFHGILSRSPAMQDVFHLIQNAAETAVTVLVRGESGTGKELVAKAIHDLSIRKNAPFLAINCAALSSNLLESELFGHVRGAFTGAIKDHSGLFQRAHGGTLFLDEVAELPLELQAKLLRVIQERNYIPVGGDRSVSVDVRIIAATHRSLREEVKNGRFREDLMYRLRVVPIFLPPLRERREDIGLLIWHFIHQHNAANFRKIEKIEPLAMRTLLDYPWLGNVRELQNVVEYAFAVGRGTTLRLTELPPEFREPRAIVQTAKSNTTLSAEQEATAIRQALEQSNGKVTPAAQLLGMSRATFWRKRKLYAL
ncbi:MAG: sigma-54 dependent transcriptional regulator [Methylococcaceae bacterium]|nr:sigma-54 dependent transcriptional regulator [Methylococcaceae bacterium]